MYELIRIIIFIVGGSFILRSDGFCAKRDSNCGTTRILWPFWTSDYGDPRCYQYSGFKINCTEDEKSVITISGNPYVVQNMDSSTIKVLDMDIAGQTCPRPRKNFSIQFSPFLDYSSDDKNITIFYNCTNPPNFVESNLLPCLDHNKRRSFWFVRDEYPAEYDWRGECEDSVETVVSMPGFTDTSDLNYTDALPLGIPLKYSPPVVCVDCQESGGQCTNISSGFRCHCADNTFVDNAKCLSGEVTPSDGDDGGISPQLKILIGVFSGLAAILLVLFLIYRRILYESILIRWKNNFRSPTKVDLFLESHGCLAQRYWYSEIKRMTNSFKDQLGQGGYGSVYKGKLHSGRLVAVKLLNESKGDGEEFINEVVTIGTTNHINVVSLLGFCTEGTKRALVYEFMQNGSLEKFIYQEKEAKSRIHPLGLQKLYQIALGIAKGLDYLHWGCNTRILHLDIKPHNILLDSEFHPKIADFGLAKRQEGTVSMQAPRGTLGYIAPEMYCINFGPASHKSDVYSYGIMVLEMIGGRKNMDILAKNTSEIFLPQLIYNRFVQDIQVEEYEEYFKEVTTRKMVIAALWCIQAQPKERPSINKVVEMLEGSVEELQMPPNPFADLPSGLFDSMDNSVMHSESTESRNYLSQSSLGGR